jgi:hypothetical protein
MMFAVQLLWFSPLSAKKADASERSLTENCQQGLCEIFKIELAVARVRSENGVTVPRGSGDPGVVVIDAAAKRTEVRCSKAIRVPFFVRRGLLSSMRRVTQSLRVAPPVVLNPSDQVLMLMYATVMQQTQGFSRCPGEE